jgi:DNA-binding PadR family transcriptional regulator
MNTPDKTTANWMKEAQKGYIRVAVLILLNKKPAHGYEIMKKIKDRTRGFWTPTPGGVYTILQKLEENHYIKGEWTTQNNRKIKIYSITDTGRDILRRALLKQNQVANNINSLFQEFARDVLNVESETLPVPMMQGPFSAFLEEEAEPKTTDVKELEKHREHLQETIDMLKKTLVKLDKELAQARKAEKKNSQA